MSRIIFVFSYVLAGFSAIGQTSVDSLTVLLDTVIINEDKLKGSEIGLSVTKIDSLMLSALEGANFSELMRATGVAGIRSYGPGGLSTPSFRGTGGSHTAILWNGIHLQSPLSGQQDLSLIPIGFVEDVQIQKGGSSSLYGSGAIGGTIQLNNKLRLDQGLKISSSQEIGSFGNHYQKYQIDRGTKNSGISTRIFQRKLTNDFPYINRYVRPAREEKRDHSAVKQQGILQQIDWLIKKNQLLGFKLWYQNNVIEIPNSIGAGSVPEAVQKDEFARGLFTWNLDKSRFGLGYKQAYIWHHLNFSDPSTRTHSSSAYTSWTNRIEADFDLSASFVLVLGANHKYEKADVDTFGTNQPDRNSTALFSSLRYSDKHDRFNASFSIREELTDTETAPISPSLGATYKITPNLKLNGNTSKNYRIPTFNNLYWNGEGGQGNSALLPELSWSKELGAEFQFLRREGKSFLIKASAYSSIVDNWIRWQPISADVWSPENVKQVWSRGIESGLSGYVPFGFFSIAWSATYNFTKTTNKEVSDQGSQREVGKQLFYTPIHKGNFSLKFDYKGIHWVLTHSYTGKQFTDGDNSAAFALPSYQVLSSYVTRHFDFDSFSGNLRFKINNLLNEAYENRRGYPMYGRNFTIGLDIQFDKLIN